MNPQTPTLETPARESPDPKAVEAFVGKVFDDLAGTALSLVAAIGEQHGLFRALADHGAQTPKQLASRTKTSERYVGEWLKALTVAGYVLRDPKTETYRLPPEAVGVLARDGTPASVSGFYPQIRSIVRIFDEIANAFKTGRGVNPACYDDDFHAGQERFTQYWFNDLLVQDWIPRARGVKAKLESGADVR